MGKTTKEIVIDFFRPRVTRGTFSEALKKIAALPLDEQRNHVSSSGHPIRMHTLRKVGKVWQGEIVQIRMTDLPKVYSVKGDSEDLDLDDDQGIGQGIAFSYHESTDVLLVQRNKFAISAASLERYLMAKGKAGVIELIPVLTKSAYNRLYALSRVTKVSVKVANIEKGNIFSGSKHGLSELGRLRDMLSAPTIELTASVGGRNSGLDRPGVLGLVQSLWNVVRNGKKDDVVKTILVKGRNVDQELDTINLLAESMQVVTRVTTDDRRTISFDERIAALLNAWEDRQAELLELLQEKMEAAAYERTD